ncbi:MAG: SDR family NAD(P)-dependent oxidoreductase, partial [Boseongicola sp. SB0662_bin_57]|nr:SDR family NAD(P)-dependent oxidoreductase [Boseongicola sp. SB0662_bin_57]
MPEFAIFPSLQDKTVLVTGGAQGIGAEIVRAFANQGAKVGFIDLDSEGSAALASSVEGIVDFETCDLRDVDTQRNAIAALARRLGNPSVLVNNAARDDRHDW